MLNASQLADGWKQLLSRLGSAEELEATAKASGALLRRREIKSAADLLRLALAYGPCGMSLRTAAAWAATMGLGDLSDVAVLNRLRASADWLQEIVGWLLAQRLNCSSATPGRIIRLVDGTTISEPGSDRADWRLHYSYDPRSERTPTRPTARRCRSVCWCGASRPRRSSARSSASRRKPPGVAARGAAASQTRAA